MRPVFAVPALGLMLAAAAPLQAGEVRCFEDAALHAVQFVDKQEGWAVGDDGVVWHTIDAGKEWERVPTGVRASLRSVCFVNPFMGWIAGREELPGGGSAGVLLFTEDEGVHWRRVLLNATPGLNVVRFLDDKTGYLLGDAADQYPSGVFLTTDGGRTWQPAPGPRAGSWLAGDFTEGKGGALVGAWNRLATVRRDKVFSVEMEAQGGRNLRGVRLHGQSGVAVGQGGLVLLTETGGSSWDFAKIALSEGVRYDWDFHAVHGAGDHYWAVGRPGSVVLHTPDGGAHWQMQRTGQPLPLNGVFFIDEEHGWAVGELGAILATADGGRNWKLQRRGGQRAAALFVNARAAGTPLDAVALLGGQDGYLTAAVRVTTSDPGSAAPAKAAEGARFGAAVRQAGGAAAETLWQFPVASHLTRCDRDDLLRAWNPLHGDRAPEQMLRQMVLTLRMWRPDVIVTDSPEPTAPAADAFVADAMREAFKAAADPKAFPEQLSSMGLEPWKAAKLYGRWEGRTEAQVTLDATALSVPLESTPREYAAVPALLLGEDAAPPVSRKYRLLADHREGAANHHDLMQGVDLAPGGLARRPLTAAADTAPLAALKAVRQRAALQALAEAPAGGLTDPQRLLGQIGPMLADMPDDQAGQAAFAVASRFARTGQWNLAREVFLLQVDRYPAHPLTPEAFRWLIRHNCSSEARRRNELGQFVAVEQVGFGRPRADGGLVQADFRPDKDADKPGALRPVKGDGEVEKSQKLIEFGGKAQTRKWHEGALEIEPRLAALGPLFGEDAATQFCLQAARRTLGDADGPNQWYARFAERQPDGPWRAAAAAELWLARREGPCPKPVVNCRQTDARPFLDGKQDDACWQDAQPLRLRNASGDTAGDYPTEARVACDREFLYLTVRCGCPADKQEPLAKTRTHDLDLRDHDRVSLLLDLDRDYSTCFHFQIDQRGCIADDCWGDKTWDPRWFVAVHKEEKAWVLEAAIPLATLTGDAVAPGKAWACNVVRVLPGRGVQAWSLPAEAPEEAQRPEGMGLLLFAPAADAGGR